MTTDRALASDAIAEASARLLRSVDGFHGDDWDQPSLLPDWSRATLVAHLALNAEALSRLLRGVVADDDDRSPDGPTMYESDEQRAHDIRELAGAEPSEIRGRLMAATTIFQDAIEAMPADRWETRVERTPGGRVMRASSVPGMRWRELEIHHVDLGVAYTTADWSPGFAAHLLDAMVKRLDPRKVGGTRGLEIRPLDSDRVWVLGDGEAQKAAEHPVPVVTGPAADLGLWLTGRTPPETLSCSHGELPVIEGW